MPLRGPGLGPRRPALLLPHAHPLPPGPPSARGVVLPPLAAWLVPVPSDWLERVNRPQRPAEVHAMELSLKRGQPLGETDWQQRIARKLGLEHTFRPRGRPRKKPMDKAR